MREGTLQERTNSEQKFWNASKGRTSALEILCPWIVCLLKRLGRFEMATRRVDRLSLSASIENAAEQFLYQMSASPEP